MNRQPDGYDHRPLSKRDIGEALLLTPVAAFIVAGLILGVGFVSVAFGGGR